MKSSTGVYFVALDHIRALAAFMVFTWHFTHAASGYPVAFSDTPRAVPLAILDEGHTGVALFMTLSGYLFAKLLDGKSIRFRAFLWNRAVRLMPLLSVVVLIDGILAVMHGTSVISYIVKTANGAVFATLPNGGWSITVEFHFYLILPVLLWMQAKSRALPITMLAAAIALRIFLYSQNGEIQTLSYWTIIGRIDQFLIGIAAFQFRRYFVGHHIVAAAVGIGFSLIYWFFDFQGGFYGLPAYPSPSAIWILLPTIEGIAYGIGIAWYDGSFTHTKGSVSRFIAKIGDYSYSIYLLHVFFVFEAARFVNVHIMDISNFYLACLWSVVFFLLMMPIGYLSHRFIEAPFLTRRMRYLITRPVVQGEDTPLTLEPPITQPDSNPSRC